MRWILAHIGSRLPAGDPLEALTQTWLRRIGSFAQAETAVFATEAAFWDSLAKKQRRTAPFLVALDSRGREMSSEDFAAWAGALRDRSTQEILFVVGPASGWSEAARDQMGAMPHLVLSLGKMTLAHALARAVLAEQLYRASTILSGHPYHTGH